MSLLTNTLIIDITEDDIKNGNVKKPESCAAALALKRGLHNIGIDSKVEVDSHVTSVFIDDLHFIFNNPIEMDEWVEAFDTGAHMLPGEFTIEFYEVHSDTDLNLTPRYTLE